MAAADKAQMPDAGAAPPLIQSPFPQKNSPYMTHMTYMAYIPSLYLRAKPNFFPKFFKIRLAIVQKAVYIRKSSVILELNASVDLMKLIKNFEKSFKVDLKNCLKCDIL